ncbi:MAG TPA: DUF1800 domain-containing protein [Vicinamibacterales bacterium]|nr:DUF1800 domain-containing protein [Vicinamibacterales bacterium]
MGRAFLPALSISAIGAICTASCARNPAPARRLPQQSVDARVAIHVLNRVTFGPRPGGVERVQAMGVDRYVDEQLHPERMPDLELERRLAALPALGVSASTFATVYYQPMIKARQEFTATQKLSAGGAKLPALRWHLQPIAAVSLPGGTKAVSVLSQAAVTPEELFFQRENQQIFDELQAQKVLRAVYSERQLQEALTDFWFNHFNVDARKIEDRPVVVEYERDVIRPHVLGRFRDLLDATAKSPAMLFYLDNWLSAAPPVVQAPRPSDGPQRSRPASQRGSPASSQGAAAPKPVTPGRGLNENYARELMELHTLGVDGGYTQHDVMEVARCFTGWTMRNPHDGSGFFFNDKVHDHGAKRVLGHRIREGRGIEDGEQVLDILSRHPSTARFIATKLVRRFVADAPPKTLVDRAARTFSRTDGDLREVVRTILSSREFYAAAAYRAKVKSPFEYVVSALRATNASVTNVRAFVGIIGALGEPLYQCQPPTGYGDRAEAWINTGALVARVNFAQNLAANGANASKVDLTDQAAPSRLSAAVLGDELSDGTRLTMAAPQASPAVKIGLLLGSPEFQRR